MSVHIATATIAPAQGGQAVTVNIHDHHLRNRVTLGKAISDAVIESLAKSVQQATAGLIVPCNRCGTPMTIVDDTDPSGVKERGLTCPKRTCPGNDEFWPVP